MAIAIRWLDNILKEDKTTVFRVDTPRETTSRTPQNEMDLWNDS